MNTSFKLVTILILLGLAALACGGPVSVSTKNPGSVEEEIEASQLQVEEGYNAYLFASTLSLTADQLWVAPGVKLLTAASGEFIGLAVPVSVGVIVGAYISSVSQDMIEGRGVQDTISRFHSIQEVTANENGEIITEDGQVIARIDENTAEYSAEGEQANAQAREEEKTQTKKLRRVAVCEDDETWILILTEIFTEDFGAQVLVFISCEQLLITLDSGADYDLYVIDNHLAGEIGGPKCTAEIRKRRPSAIIVGIPGDKTRKGPDGTIEERFLQNGAQSVLEKGDSQISKKIMEFVRQYFETR